MLLLLLLLVLVFQFGAFLPRGCGSDVLSQRIGKFDFAGRSLEDVRICVVARILILVMILVVLVVVMEVVVVSARAGVVLLGIV